MFVKDMMLLQTLAILRLADLVADAVDISGKRLEERLNRVIDGLWAGGDHCDIRIPGPLHAARNRR